MLFLLVGLLGCSDKTESETSDTTESESTKAWLSADLAELSSGECPDMSNSGDSVIFTSSGEQRTVTVVSPADPQPGMGIIFWYHGFLDASMSDVTGQTATGMGFQQLANQTNSLIILPQSGIWNLLGLYEVYMWNVEDGTFASDLALYDDLRTCAANNFDVNLDKLTVGGFSGGSLFLTVLLSQRGDTLSAVSVISGGADIEVDILGLFEEPLSPYETPSHKMPILLVSGQEQDVWPDPSFTIIDFYSSTDHLEAQVRSDGHPTVRCLHDRDHFSPPNWAYDLALDWLTLHDYGVESPLIGNIDAYSEWCVE